MGIIGDRPLLRANRKLKRQRRASLDPRPIDDAGLTHTDWDTPSFAATFCEAAFPPDGEEGREVFEVSALHLWYPVISACGYIG